MEFNNYLKELIGECEEKENRLEKEFAVEKQRLLVGNTNYIMLKVKLSNKLNNESCKKLLEAIKDMQFHYEPKASNDTFDSTKGKPAVPISWRFPVDDVSELINKIYKNLNYFIEQYN